ncbi:tetratricopeptide repeat protein [Sorangium sp. So ce861]|uniref:tetratricopeptide repeat protein n=1 Tax=Sorangium sp. So ce861 TaxID=3133323 RepID=UPI003F6311B4
MKDDALREAARALREEADTSVARRDETRARVMRSLKAQRARRLTTVRVVVPLAAVLVGSAAWASAARWFPDAFHDIASQLGLSAAEPPSAPPAPPSPRARSGPRHAAEAPAPEAPEVEAPAPTEAEASAAPIAPAPPSLPTADPPVAPAPQRAPELAVTPRARPPVAPSAARPAPSAARPAPARASASDPQAIQGPPPGPDADALYQAAHRAHFVERDPASALSAWDAYLAAAPRGRFAVEAQYNRALCLVRLGRKDEAQRALDPFAQGSFGGYRQAESRSLLEAMRSADE